MSDHYTTNVEAAAHVAQEQEPVDRDFDPADDAPPRYPPLLDAYVGQCGGCGGYVDPREGPACLWRPPHPWHPECRALDKAAGGTRDQAPA